MKTTVRAWSRLLSTAVLGMALMALLLMDSGGGLAQQVSTSPGSEPHHVTLTGPAPFPPAPAASGKVEGSTPSSIASLSGSHVETHNCYQANRTQTFCFTVYNGSTDWEWLDQVTLTFPDDPNGLPAWTVSSCNFQQGIDSLGHTVNFSCTPSGNQVIYADSDADGYGEIAPDASWVAWNATSPSGALLAVVTA